MKKDNLIICTSSFNNYEMLENEVFQNINFEGFEFINVDDKSTEIQQSYGKNLCKKNEIVFLENEKKGVQYAVNTLVKFIKKNRPNCKWIFLFQHDNYPITNLFFSRLSSLIDNGIPKDISVIGFNHLDYGEYTFNGYKKWLSGKKPIGILGKMHLSVKHETKRWAAPRPNWFFWNFWNLKKYLKYFKKPFSIEVPLETAIGINIDDWKNIINPTTDYEFHLWFSDIMMQFLNSNKHCVILPELYCFNDQNLKTKYGINKCSAQGAKNGDSQHFGEYSNFEAWKLRWGWDYDNVASTFPKDKYKGTLIYEFFKYDIMKEKKPFKSYNFEY